MFVFFFLLEFMHIWKNKGKKYKIYNQMSAVFCFSIFVVVESEVTVSGSFIAF